MGDLAVLVIVTATVFAHMCYDLVILVVAVVLSGLCSSLVTLLRVRRAGKRAIEFALFLAVILLVGDLNVSRAIMISTCCNVVLVVRARLVIVSPVACLKIA